MHDSIIEWSHTAFSSNVVDDIIQPTVDDILRHGRGEILTVGFLLSLWAGSSAMSSFVDAITVAHDQYGVRNEVWQRIFALLLYLAALVLLVIGLPILALGPDLLPRLFPAAWRNEIAYWVNAFYYPVIAVLLVLALATLYKLALPRKLPWHRGLPGAVLAMIVFLLSSIGLRLYISWITTTGYTYGALATPIAFLLFAFFIGLAIVIGAYFNAAMQEMWPARMTRRQRRKWRRLEMSKVVAPPVAKPRPADPVAGPAADHRRRAPPARRAPAEETAPAHREPAGRLSPRAGRATERGRSTPASRPSRSQCGKARSSVGGPVTVTPPARSASANGTSPIHTMIIVRRSAATTRSTPNPGSVRHTSTSVRSTVSHHTGCPRVRPRNRSSTTTRRSGTPRGRRAGACPTPASTGRGARGGSRRGPSACPRRRAPRRRATTPGRPR